MAREDASMIKRYKLDKIAIDVKSHQLLKELLKENPQLEEIMRNAKNETEALVGVRNWALETMKDRPAAVAFRESKRPTREEFEALEWRDYAAIRILDYIDNAGRRFPDLNLRGEIAVSNPIELIWLGVTYGTGGAKPHFFWDMLQLFRQFLRTESSHFFKLQLGLSPLFTLYCQQQGQHPYPQIWWLWGACVKPAALPPWLLLVLPPPFQTEFSLV